LKVVILSCLATVVFMTAVFIIGTGYFIGNYMVHFGLERGTPENPQEPPRAYALLMPPESRHYNRPDFLSEEWSLRSEDGLHLVATHFSPEEQSDRWVIVAHGYGCNQNNSYYIAANYLMRGWHVLTPDLRASGASEGRFLTLGCYESEDISQWAREIATRYPRAHIILHGVSMGAATVMLAVDDADLPAQVVACVEDCGYTSAYELLAGQMEESFGLPSFPAMNLLDWRCEKVAGFSLHEAVPAVAVQHSRVPLLFIHGTSDTLVPPRMARELYAKANAPRKELLLIEGAIHAAASQKEQERYFQTISAFVEPYVGQAKPKANVRS